MQFLNDPRPWWGTLRGRPLDVADLIAAGTLTAEAAATLAWTIQHGASLFVAAGPPGAGKSTIANALLEFLPLAASVYVTHGAWDRLDIPPADGPVYLLINELSAHMPLYLHGPAAQRAFELSRSGARIVGTLHAGNSAEALRVMCYEAALSPEELAAPFVFAAVQAGWRGQVIERRVVEIGFVPPGGAGVHRLFPADPRGLQALSEWTGERTSDIGDQIAMRAAALDASTTPARG